MGDEDSIMVSTELNGDALPDTVDPSRLGLQSLPHLRNERLPFHSPSKASSFTRTDVPTSSMYQASSSPDKMDVSLSTPLSKRRSSPEVRIAPRPRVEALPYATSRTGLVYDSRMRFHAELPGTSTNADDIHPEDPRRINSIFEELSQANLVTSVGTDSDSSESHCWRIDIRMATRAQILLIHTEEHYDFVESLQCTLSSCICLDFTVS